MFSASVPYNIHLHLPLSLPEKSSGVIKYTKVSVFHIPVNVTRVRTETRQIPLGNFQNISVWELTCSCHQRAPFFGDAGTSTARAETPPSHLFWKPVIIWITSLSQVPLHGKNIPRNVVGFCAHLHKTKAIRAWYAQTVFYLNKFLLSWSLWLHQLRNMFFLS